MQANIAQLTTNSQVMIFALLPNSGQEVRLKQTVESFNRARQYVLDAVHGMGTLNKMRIRAHVNSKLQKDHRLSPKMVAHIISTVIDTENSEILGGEIQRGSWRRGRLTRTFIQKNVIPTDAPMPLTDSMITFPADGIVNAVSVLCVGGREVVPARLLSCEPAVQATKHIVAELIDDVEQNIFFLHYFAPAAAADAIHLEAP